MSLALFIYLCSIVHGISTFLGFGGFAILIVGSICIIHGNCEKSTSSLKWGKILVPFAVFMFFVNIFIPSEKAMYLMGGAYAVQKTVESPEVQKINERVFQMINKKLDEYAAIEEPKKSK